jgi:hypothetical protein
MTMTDEPQNAAAPACGQSPSTEGLGGRWHDMGLYWAWRGDGAPDSEPPTVKRIEYATIRLQGKYLNGPKQGERITMSLAVTVFDDGVPKEVNRGEMEWFRQQGSEITMPANVEVSSD